MLDQEPIILARNNYKKFLNYISYEDNFKFTPNSEATEFSRCFAIFGLHLIGETDKLSHMSHKLSIDIRNDLDLYKDFRQKNGHTLIYDKPYLQLLAFSLSALTILGTLEEDPLEDHIKSLISYNIDERIKKIESLKGKAQSGNQAMFIMIILYHANHYLNIDTLQLMQKWQKTHKDALNKFGFFGVFKSMSHLQFQNGYHQYEMFDYFQTEEIPWDKASFFVASLADEDGHFAPYPGGGGCFDYDAVYLITCSSEESIKKHTNLLLNTAESILSEQNPDGGFCESNNIRPRNFENILKSIKHVKLSKGLARKERLRQFITLLRVKHDYISTHWSNYSREWGESDLWDSWFRMLTIARIDIVLNPSNHLNWGFINYPGIGFHSITRSKNQ
jgi:hypothetical protein